MGTQVLPKYYVYTLAYPDGKVFYVGKGTGPRIEIHEREVRRPPIRKPLTNPAKASIIREVWASGQEIIKRKLAYFESEDQAYRYEIALIFFLPDLVNRTNGGLSGYEVSLFRR